MKEFYSGRERTGRNLFNHIFYRPNIIFNVRITNQLSGSSILLSSDLAKIEYSLIILHWSTLYLKPLPG